MKVLILLGIFVVSGTTTFAREGNFAIEAHMERQRVAFEEKAVKEVQAQQTEQPKAEAKSCELPKHC
jgi:hypothetical protein